MVALNFNAAGVKPNAALEPLPTGIYNVIITNSQEKPTKAGTGSYIEFEMTVQGGEFNGRKVFDRLNTNNPNQTAVDIAYGTLSAMCHVTGVLNLQDTAQLHGKPFQAVVSKVPRADQPGSFSNEVKGYKDINGNDPGMAGQVAQPQAQPQWAAAPAQQPVAQPQPAPAHPQAPAQNWQQPQAPQPAPAYAPPAAAPAPAYVPNGAAPAGPAGAGAPPPWAAGQ